MVEGELKLDRCLMAVGDLDGPAAADLARLAGEYEIAVTACENIYAAVAELAGRPDRDTLIVGQLEELTRENGAFFAIAARHSARCGCWLRADRPSDGAALTAAVQGGARFINGNSDLAVMLADWFAADRDNANTPVANDLRRVDEELRTTQAELSALLGQEMND
jgi:hypothetical protein